MCTGMYQCVLVWIGMIVFITCICMYCMHRYYVLVCTDLICDKLFLLSCAGFFTLQYNMYPKNASLLLDQCWYIKSMHSTKRGFEHSMALIEQQAKRMLKRQAKRGCQWLSESAQSIQENYNFLLSKMPFRLCPARVPWPAARPCAVAGNSSPRLRILGSAPARPCRFKSTNMHHTS